MGAEVNAVLEQWMPGWDPSTGILPVPLWLAVLAAASLLTCCVLVLIWSQKVVASAAAWGLGCFRQLSRWSREEDSIDRTRYAGSVSPGAGMGWLPGIALVLLGAAIAWLPQWRAGGMDKHALDARVGELAIRAAAPGSALACLDGQAGAIVEASCENALFASPEATAAAVSYVAAQLWLLAEATDHARRGSSGYDSLVNSLRRTAEADRFGLVAYVLAQRDGCTPDECRGFALLRDSSRVSANLIDRTYELFVLRHAGSWPTVGTPPMAAREPVTTGAVPATVSALSLRGSASSTGQSPTNSPLAPMAAGKQDAVAAPSLASTPTAAGRTPPNNLFFPSSASIPPVSIMTTEPSAGTNRPAAAAVPVPPLRGQATQRKGVAAPTKQTQPSTSIAPPAAAAPSAQND
jgi:hypothetical protein